MSTTQPFYARVPESGTITLPPEFWTTEVMILETTPKKPKSMESNEFWQTKSLEEIAAEQGGSKICVSPDAYFGSLAFLWDSEEEIETFLEKRREEI